MCLTTEEIRVVPIKYHDGIPIFGPQEGPQKQALESQADIVIYGGQAGGGKSVELILEGAKHVHRKNFTGIIFRRNYNDIVKGGGLWDTSYDIYKALGGIGTKKSVWKFPADSSIELSHIHNTSDVFKYFGLQYAYIGFDELQQFEEMMFFYMIARNRPYGDCNIKPYIRGGCNPDADCWLARFISWWIDQETGYAIPERCGKIRHMARQGNDLLWVPPEYRDDEGLPPKSVTFIEAKLSDNKMMPFSAEYRAGINVMSSVERERLGKGNWLISFSGGLFDSRWFVIVEEIPEDIKLIRYWDLAATELDEDEMNDPDFTAGVKGGIKDGVFYIVDVVAFRKSPGQAEEEMRRIAEEDGREVTVAWEQEKASAGKWTTQYLLQVFEGFNCIADPVEGKKEERAAKWAAWAEWGKVRLLKGEWNNPYKAQTGKFPLGKRDKVDATSGLFKLCVGPLPVFSYYNPKIHVEIFKKEKDDFDKLNISHFDIYIVLYLEEDGSIWGGFYLWSRVKKKLKIYDEIIMEHPTPQFLSNVLKEKAIVPLNEKTHFLTVKKIYANDRMIRSKKSDVAKEMRKHDIRISEAILYDEISSQFRVNRMFADGEISVHSDLIETDNQLRGWHYKDKRLASGYPLARCLCIVESHIKPTIAPDVNYTDDAYSGRKERIRNKLRNRKQIKKHTKEHDWMVQ